MPGVVAYIGTFAKTLAPTLRLGYLIAPAPLRERIVTLKDLFVRHTSWPIQRAALELLRGETRNRVSSGRIKPCGF